MAHIQKDNSIERPPIVVIVGHIDHGKSSLLDYIRKTNIVAREAGGITQHLSAYEVVHNDKKITFLDTPGHEAFTEMRIRGARAADIAIVVIGADDGVQVQTKEALKAVSDAGIPYIIALNKIDLPAADPERVKQQLAEEGIFVEGYGGQIPQVSISAKKGTGVSDLLDLILLAAELEELRANPSAPAEGHVIESHMDTKRGATATLIVTNGTLEKKGFVVAGDTYAPVRILEDFLRHPIAEASVSAPVLVAGFNRVPEVGTAWRAVADKKEAERAVKLAVAPEVHVERTTSEVIIPIIVKADTRGTLEAVLGEIRRHETESVALDIVARGVGPITENDIRSVAAGTEPIVLGFNVKIDRSALDAAERLGISTRSFTIIYELSDFVRQEIERRSPKITTEVMLGKARILRTFGRAKEKQIIGGVVSSGAIAQGKTFRIIRNAAEIGTGTVIELQQAKIKTDRVEENNQYGAQVSSRVTLAAGDILDVIDVVHS